ncbi:MAG: endonuclease/exonuclease/phosphatase family protein [Spirochaetia bacterium]|nr:endonuclease/exonuclease/phosphatase family protein [Spirochaetia bacterium]
MRLTVLDFNVWSGLTYMGFRHMGQYGDNEYIERRMQLTIAQIKDLNPDVVCLHELNMAPEVPLRIASEINMKCYFRTHLSGIRLGSLAVPRNLKEADAIFVRDGIPFEPLGRARLSGGFVGEFASLNTTDATQIIGVRLQMEGVPVNVFTTHWHAGIEPGPDIERRAARIAAEGEASQRAIQKALTMLSHNVTIRRREAERTLRFIDSFKGPRAILSGDFNSQPDSAEIGILRGAGFADTFETCNPGDPGHTWDYAANVNQRRFYSERDPDLYLRLNYTRLKVPHRLDYIFSRGNGLRALASRVVMTEVREGLQASDHFGVLTVFEIQDEV